MTRGPESSNRRPRLLLIGWDGATPELLERFVGEERLPTVQRLMKSGAYRPLRSTIPPVTACAWSSFLTGKNPGKHGLFEFVAPRPGTYQFDYTNGGYRRDTTDLLTLLNRAGLKVGCVNVPMTFPPRAIDGFVISGLDAPDEGSGIAQPADAFAAACAEAGGYRIDNRHLGAMRTNADRAAALAEFTRIEALRTDVTLALLRRIPVDVLMLVYNATDQVQHHFWHLMDPQHPQYPGAASADVQRFGHAIAEVYAACDRELARLVDGYPEASVMLLSDHGGGATRGPCVRINNVLAAAGLLTWADRGGGLKTRVASASDRFLRRTLSARQKAFLARLMPGARTAIESASLPAIDWSRTVAFAYEGFTLSPSVWINRRDTFPAGRIGGGAEYDDACQRVIAALTAVRDPRTGAPAIPRVYRAREIYSGDFVVSSPDLILDWWEGQTFTMVRSGPSHDRAAAVFYPTEPLVSGQDISGIHRRDGILVTGGPLLPRGGEQLAPADLIDIAPTTLALLGLPVPTDMDGRLLPELKLRDERVAVVAEPAAAGPAPGYSDRERELIEQRLAALGYMDTPTTSEPNSKA